MALLCSLRRAADGKWRLPALAALRASSDLGGIAEWLEMNLIWLPACRF
jgi:hypothetical protein